MFCPRCGQQQVSEEVRFCSRCGFQLGGVAPLLATNGLPLPGLTNGFATGETPRRKGVRQGGKLILFGIFLIPLMLMLHEIFRAPEELAFFGVITFLGGLLRLIYALIFEEGPWRRRAGASLPYAPPAALNLPGATAGRAASELPPAQSIPTRAYVPPGFNTAEMSRPPSVTEGPTRLLDEQDQQGR